MFTSRCQALMTQGFSLANKWYFRQWNQYEFDKWIDDCRSLLSSCEPEPYLPYFPTVSNIEEIVMLLGTMSAKISRGQVQYLGIF
jgi:hypothetical protein